MRQCGAVGLFLLAGLAGTQTTTQPSLTDGKGFVLYYQGIEGELVGTDRFEGIFTGNPLRGESRQQGLRFSMRRLEGTLRRMPDESYRLLDAEMSGNVVLNLGQADATPSHELRSERATLEDKTSSTVVTVPTAFTLTGRVQNVSRYTVTGQTATAVFGPMGREAPALQRVTASGNVRTRLVTDRGEAGFTAPRVTIRPEGENVTMTGDGGVNFTYQSREQQANRVMTIRMTSVSAVVGPGQDPLSSLDGNGAVTLRLEWTGVPGEGQSRTRMVLTGVGRDLKYRAAQRTLTMRDAQFEGQRRVADEGRSAFGTLTAQLLTIQFNEAGEVQRVVINDPNGLGTLREQPDQP